MSACVATLYSPDCAPLAELTNPNKQSYCDAHGYSLALKTTGYDSGYSRCGWHYLAFERFKFFRECLEKFGLVLGCGADVLITNPAIALEDLAQGRKPILIALDAIGFQTDVMLFRQCDRAFQFIDAMIASAPVHINSPFVDQTAFAELYPKFQDSVEIVPQRMINAFDYTSLSHWYPVNPNYSKAVDANGNDGQWQPGDFIFHCPGLSMPHKLALLRDHLSIASKPQQT